MEGFKSLEINGKTYEATLETEIDDLGNEQEYLALRNGEEVHKLSPNTTAEELAKYADPNDKGHTL